MPCNLKAYATLSNETLRYIIKDAKEAQACARDLGDTAGEMKYADQVNDACTILHRRVMLQARSANAFTFPQDTV